MLCDGNAEVQHILHKCFIMWAIIQYLASNRVLKMDSGVLAKIDSSTEARVFVRGSDSPLQCIFVYLQVMLPCYWVQSSLS